MAENHNRKWWVLAASLVLLVGCETQSPTGMIPTRTPMPTATLDNGIGEPLSW